MLSGRGLSVLLTEAVLFLPAWAYALLAAADGDPLSPGGSGTLTHAAVVRGD